MSGVKQASYVKPLFRSSKSRQQTDGSSFNHPVTRSSVSKQENATEKKGLGFNGGQFQGQTLNAGQQCAPTSVFVENEIEHIKGNEEAGSQLRPPPKELPSLKIKRKSLDRRTPGKRKKRRGSTTKLINGEQPDNENSSADADAVDTTVDNSNKPIYYPQTVANFSVANSSSIDREIAVNSSNPLNPLVHTPILGSDTSCIKSSTPARPSSVTLTHVPGTSPLIVDKNGSTVIAAVNEHCGFSIVMDNSSSNCLFDNSSFGRDDSALAAFDLSGVVCSYESTNKPKNKNTCPVTEPSSDSNQINDDQADCEKRSFEGEVKNKTKSRFFEEFFGDDSLPEDNKTPRQPKIDNSFYGLPQAVKKLLEQHRGISKFYDWQTDCLNLPAVIEGKNLIYSLPTSGGKTLVAEILIMKELLVKQKDALFILPFVSIVQEKVKSLTQFAVDLGFLIEEYAGSRGKIPPRKRKKKKSLYIATIEKANALVNSLIEENRIDEIGLVVVDELHMLGEGGGRGATLETCLAKLLFSTKATQIIGMSATLSNINDLEQFLKAEVFSSDFRPVELCEYFKIGTSIYEVKASKFGHHEEPSHAVVKRVQHHKSNDKQLLMRDPDHIVSLVMEVIPKHSCLVFCPTKKNCQSLVEMLASFMSREVKEVKVSERRELLRALVNQASGLCPTLKRVVPYGMAYHHSGLTMDERKLIEEAYKEGVLCLLTCTSTLAAGVNLPAKRVILRAPYVADSIINRSQYKQMIGRAGRAGIDTSGESILVLKETDKAKIGHLFAGPFDSCRSSLKYEGGKGLRALILNCVGLKLCSSRNDLKSFINCTLLAVQCQEGPVLENETSSALQSLIELGHLREKGLKKGDEVELRLEVTELGQATFKGCIDTDASPSLSQDIRRAVAAMGPCSPECTPDSTSSAHPLFISNTVSLQGPSGGCVDIDKSPVIYDDVKKAQESLVLSNELHLLYLVTPLDMATFDPNWMVYFRQITLLNEVEQKAAETIGVSEGFLSRRATGQRFSKDKVSMLVVRRFYLTLMLYRLVREHTVWNVADTFQVTRGFAQNLLASASSFASCMVRFTEELKEFWAIRLLLEAMVKKLSYTASIELIPLLEVPGVKQARARQFYRAGYKTLQHLARANVEELVKQIEHLPRKQARQIVSAAKMLLEDKADALREEAEEMVALSSPSTST